MNTFIINLLGATKHERIENICSFVGEDASGSFCIMSGHARFITSLVFGLARIRFKDGITEFIAMPGGLLYFIDGELAISTRQYFRDRDYERISEALRDQLLADEERLQGLKLSLQHMEEEMLRKLWKMRREGEAESL